MNAKWVVSRMNTVTRADYKFISLWVLKESDFPLWIAQTWCFQTLNVGELHNPRRWLLITKSHISIPVMIQIPRKSYNDSKLDL